MAECGVFTDWEVAEAQRDAIVAALPATFRTPIQIRKYIQGMSGKRLGEGVRAGIWLKPLGSESGTTFNAVQDVRHSTLLVMVQPSSTGDSSGAPRYDTYRQLIRGAFQNRRSTGLLCELFSQVDEADYEIDERLQRKMDVNLMVITTTIREAR